MPVIPKNSGCIAALATFLALPVHLNAQEISLDAEAVVESTTSTTPPKNQTSDEATQAAIAAETTTTTPDTPRASQRLTQTRVRRRAVPTTFVLRDIKFSPSQYISQAQLDAVERKLVGVRYRRVSLNAIAAAVSQLYLDQGIFTAQALVRDVNFAKGILDIELLEARIGKVTYQSNSLSDKYLAYRLNTNAGDMADNRLLERRLNAFQITDGVNLQAGYAPGASHGLTDMTVIAPDIPKHATTITLDNYGSESSGTAQLTLAHTIYNLTGWNDPLSFSYTYREGSDALSLGYRRVVAPRGAAISFSLSGSNSKTLTAPSSTGKTLSASIGYSYPVITETKRQLTFGGAISYFSETSDLLGVRTLDHRGYEVSVEMSTFNLGNKWSLTSRIGLMSGRYDNRVAALNGLSYTAATINASYARSLGPDIFVTATIGGQYAISGVMPSTRQFTVTAPNAVRGYPTSLSSGSSGYFARFQLEKSTPYKISNSKIGLRPFAFVDAGEACDSSRVALGFASSIGLGMSFTHNNKVYGDIYIAKPMTTAITGWASPSRSPVLGGSISIRF